MLSGVVSSTPANRWTASLYYCSKVIILNKVCESYVVRSSQLHPSKQVDSITLLAKTITSSSTECDDRVQRKMIRESKDCSILSVRNEITGQIITSSSLGSDHHS